MWKKAELLLNYFKDKPLTLSEAMELDFNEFHSQDRFTQYHREQVATSIDVKEYNITSLEGLEKFPNVNYLNIANGKITSLEGIEVAWRRMMCVNLTNTKITSLKGIDSLKYLTQLYCTNTRIKTFKEILDLDKLQILDAGGIETLDKDESDFLKTYNFRLRDNEIKLFKKYLNIKHMNKIQIEQKIANLEVEIENEKLKLKFMEESKSETFDVNEFKVYQTLQCFKKEGMDDFEKSKLIAKLLDK